MKKLTLSFMLLISLFKLSVNAAEATFDKIKNFHFVSEQLASAGMLDLAEYSNIKQYGFKHVINLIPGNQIKERKHVESLGLSYAQIAVDWDNPKPEDFEEFAKLMQNYANDKVFVHCQLNWRASTFVYLYRVTHLGVAQETAKKDLLAIWTPEPTWQQFIDSTLKAYQG
jgi:protein tyrosine phosphatase (PTP) superfamily phosphohydrolase (DUF442 family)